MFPDDPQARLVRNLLALRMVLCMDQMQTGKWGDRIAEIDEELGALGHDMKSTAASAADGLRRSLHVAAAGEPAATRSAPRPSARAASKD